MKKSIIKKAQALEYSLKESSNDSSNFFREVSKKIESSKDENELKKTLESLRSIGAISQYGNFNSAQDELLDDFLKEIKYTLEKLP